MKTGWNNSGRKDSAKRKRRDRRRGGGLEDKIAGEGGRVGFGLDVSSDQEGDKGNIREAGLYGNRSVASAVKTPRIRLFQTPAQRAVAQGKEGSSEANGSRFSLSSIPTKKNPYQRKRHTSSVAASSSSHPRASRVRRASPTVHIVCAVAENLARETCVASLDAGAPVSLQVTKQGNGQTYAETLAYLEVLQPHEVLLNEGRRNSQLARKIMELYNLPLTSENPIDSDRNRRRKERSARSGGQRSFSSSVANDADSGLPESATAPVNTGPCGTSTVVKFVPRSYFDQTKGAEILRRISREDSYDSNVVEEYILLSSSHAVLQYTSLCLGANFVRSSLDLIVNSGGSNRMTIDRSSIVHLELLANAKTGKLGNSLVGTIDCTKTTVGSRLLRTNLMAPTTRTDTINTRLDLVDAFLDDEEFFYAVLEHLEALPDMDKMLTNIALVPWKKSTGSNGIEENKVTARVASKGISALVQMKSILSAIPTFASVLEDKLTTMEARERSVAPPCNGSAPEDTCSSQSDTTNHIEMGGRHNGVANDAVSTITDGSSLLIGLGGGPTSALSQYRYVTHQLLRAILATMKQPALAEVLNAVSDVFRESTTFTRNAHAMRHQECFALKTNSDEMMDVLRKAFLANVDDIYRLADEYAETHGIAVNVKETTSRGYYLAVPWDMGSDLPEVFIQPVRSGRFIHCTTEEVLSLNARAQENVQDLLLMTHDRIQKTLDSARSRYDALASLSDAIALLDMCHCFADNVASSRLQWSRPVVTDGPFVTANEKDTATRSSGLFHGRSGGDIQITNGRYGIDVTGTGLMASDELSPIGSGEFIPNDTYARESQNFTVVTGINGSGKTLYLKQIAIIVVLAHCGSFVPAEEAFIPVRDRLCTRIGTSDDQENNISTFLLEMKETARICNSASNKSLILVDELGRATSNEDGVAIAWSVSEFLLEKRAMTFFVTHYPQLSKLSDVYPAVQNQHMGATLPGDDESEVCFTHKVLPGPCKMTADYGVEMAVTCAWPSDVVCQAREIRKEIEMKLPDGALCHAESNTSGDRNLVRRKAMETLHSLSNHLLVKESDTGLSSDARRRYMEDLRTRLIPNGDLPLVEAIKCLLHHEEVAPIPLLPEALTRLPCDTNQTRQERSGGAISQDNTEPTCITGINAQELSQSTSTRKRATPSNAAARLVASINHVGGGSEGTRTHVLRTTKSGCGDSEKVRIDDDGSSTSSLSIDTDDSDSCETSSHSSSSDSEEDGRGSLSSYLDLCSSSGSSSQSSDDTSTTSRSSSWSSLSGSSD